jgi:hypothetical protein
MPGVSGVVSNREVCGLRAADLVFDPTLACCKVDAPAPAVRRRLRLRTLRHLRGTHPLVTSGPEDRERAGQGLPLNRTMLSNHKLPYVGRFACDWPRLATTDPHAARDKCRCAAAWSGRRGGPGRQPAGPRPPLDAAYLTLQFPAASPQTVSTSRRLTTYGSMLALGRRSSSHPFLAFAVAHGILMEAPRSEVP